MMNRLILILVLFLISAVNIFAEEQEKIQTVIASGVGVDADKAKQNAIRNAVEQVVGNYLSSDTIVNNNQVLKDEILSYSGGYVKGLKVISQEKDNDGLFSVKVEAGVVSTKIIKKLESLNIATKKVEGESLFGEAFSKIDTKKNAKELLGKTLSKYPQAAYSIDIGKPEIKATDASTNKATVSIPVTIKWDNAFLTELQEVLLMTASEEQKQINLIPMTSRSGDKRRDIIICFSNKALLRSDTADVCEIFREPDKEIKWLFAHSLFEHMSGKNYSIKTFSISLLFKDSKGNTIDSFKYILEGGSDNDSDGDNWRKQGINLKYDYSDSASLAYIMEGDRIYGMPPNILWSGFGNNIHRLILNDGVYKIAVTVDVNVAVLKEVSMVEAQMGKMPDRPIPQHWRGK